MADQPVQLTTHDPGWAAAFAEQAADVSTALAPWLAGPIEHIGSTAVAGLDAKPIVDILAPVRSLADAAAAIPVLAGRGWLFWPDDPNRHYRMWFLRPDPSARTHHLQVVQWDAPHARALLAFRDALRADPALRAEYAALKHRLAVQHRTDREAYTDGKSGFVRRALRAAE